MLRSIWSETFATILAHLLISSVKFIINTPTAVAALAEQFKFSDVLDEKLKISIK
jgi:hypothetical protein